MSSPNTPAPPSVPVDGDVSAATDTAEVTKTTPATDATSEVAERGDGEADAPTATAEDPVLLQTETEQGPTSASPLAKSEEQVEPAVQPVPEAAPNPPEDGAVQQSEQEGAPDGAAAALESGEPADSPAGDATAPPSSPDSSTSGGGRRVVSGVRHSSAIPVGKKSKQSSSKKTAGAPSVAVRQRRSGREVVENAKKQADDLSGGGFVASRSLNGRCMTVGEEHAAFRLRNNVSQNYRGPIYVVEDVHVPCHACGGPVDPVRRVPVGSLFFHESCVKCYLCGRRSGVAGLYLQVDRQAVCACCMESNYDSCVVHDEVESRNMVFGAIKGRPYDAIDSHDRAILEKEGRRRALAAVPRSTTSGQMSTPSWKATTIQATLLLPSCNNINKPTVEGAVPPSLSVQPLHNRRNTSQRSFELIQRQQYYTQNDNNMITAHAARGTSGNFSSEMEHRRALQQRNRPSSVKVDLPRLH